MTNFYLKQTNHAQYNRKKCMKKYVSHLTLKLVKRTLFIRRTVASCIINQVHYSWCSFIYKWRSKQEFIWSCQTLVKFLPNMHEHVAEEPPDLCAVSGMIHQRTLHEIRLVGLQHPFIEHHAVTHEHYDLEHKHTVKPDISTIVRNIKCLDLDEFI